MSNSKIKKSRFVCCPTCPDFLENLKKNRTQKNFKEISTKALKRKKPHIPYYFDWIGLKQYFFPSPILQIQYSNTEEITYSR